MFALNPPGFPPAFPRRRRDSRTIASFCFTFFLIALAVIILTGCVPAEEEAQKSENKTRQDNYSRLVASQPASTMTYSPTRETKNFWVGTWDEPGKLAYIYVLNAANDVTGYYIFEGLPVSYCTSLIPPYQLIDQESGVSALAVPGPSVDGTYSSGNDCSTKYGKDAVSGSYVEFSVGVGLSYIALDQPLPPSRLTHAKPLGFATHDKAPAKK